MKTVLITGATRGIGLELCRIFANELGYDKVYMGCRSLEKGENAKKELGNPENVISLIVDVSSEESVKNAFENYKKIKENNEKLNILINNAAAQLDWIPNGNYIKTFDIDIELLDKIYRTNVFSHLMMTRTFIPEMSEGARVVNVVSGSGEFWDCNAIMDFQPGYATSKSAAIMMSKKIAAAAKPYGVYVNSCCPGWCRTSMGGENADTSAYDGANSILAACFLNSENPPTGHHFRYGKRIMLDMHPINIFLELIPKPIRKILRIILLPIYNKIIKLIEEHKIKH